MTVPIAGPYLFKGVPRFDARGMPRCTVPGVGVQIQSREGVVADFWRQPDGTLKVRIGWMGYDWSFDARLASGSAVSDDLAAMREFATLVSEELVRWMTEDAADIPPFHDE